MTQKPERFVLLVALALLMALVWLRPLEPVAERTVDAGLKRALVSFGTARLLNALLSTAQGTEIAIEPGGVGIKFAPGQLLHPVNEMVGQFAELMLAASVAFGIMKLAISIGSYWIVSLVLTIVAGGWVWFRWQNRAPPLLLGKLLLVLLLLRFSIPLVVVGSDALFTQFMASDYTASQNAIAGNSTQLMAMAPPLEEGNAKSGMVERIKGWWSQNADVGARLQKFGAIASEATEHIVTLIVLFMMQTLIVPLLLFWALYRAGRAILAPPRRYP